MPVESLPWSIQGQSHPATVARNATAAMLGAPAAAVSPAAQILTAGGSHGVVGSGDLAVAQNGTPNMSVNVAAGRAVVRFGNASSLTAGASTIFNDATTNVAIAASDPTNPRIDLVCIEIRSATEYGQAANDARFFVIQGTPAAVPAVPALTTAPNSLVLAQVSVAAAATTIVTANITDKRTWAAAKGAVIPIATFSVAPTGAALEENTWIYERDADRVRVYDGTGWVVMSEPWQTYTPVASNLTSGGGTIGGRWKRHDGYADVEIIQSFGAAGSMATGPFFTLPVDVETGVVPSNWVAPIGTATYFDASGSPYFAVATMRTASTVEPRYPGATGIYTQWAAAVPVTPANNDGIVLKLRYRMTSRYS